jgi:hypothetical protein
VASAIPAHPFDARVRSAYRPPPTLLPPRPRVNPFIAGLPASAHGAGGPAFPPIEGANAPPEPPIPALAGRLTGRHWPRGQDAFRGRTARRPRSRPSGSRMQMVR